jgi:pimeloyl-ACP methyl ester carboxylesterase
VVPGSGAAGPHNLHYTEWGRRNSARTVVCVHGYSGNARDFDFLSRELARDARVICIDMPGRGASDWLPSPLHYHFGQFLSDIDSVIAKLGVESLDWVGTSMGGLLGLMLASRTSTPVRRLVLNDVGAFVPMDALQEIAGNLGAPERFASRAALETHLRYTHRDWGDISDAQYRHLAHHQGRRLDDGGYRLHYDPQIGQLLRPMPLTPGLFFWDAWYRLRCPVMVLRGERSRVLPASIASTMARVKSNAEVVEIAGAGHAPALMSALEIGIVRDFLADVPRTTGAARSGLRSAA